MRCFLDTNILISAGLFPNSVPAKALAKALSPPHTAIICDYSLDEMHRVIHAKFPDRIADMELFLYRLMFTVNLVQTPVDALDIEFEIRDVDDRPLLRAAIHAGADVIITGDKDFLESSVTEPCIMTAAQFLDLA